MPMGGPLMPEGVMPAAMLAGFMLPPMEAGPRGPGWFMNWLLYAWVGPIWKEEHTFNGRRRKKKNKMPHALKVQGGKVRGLRGRNTFPGTSAELGARSQRTQSSKAHYCPLQVSWENAAGGFG